MKQRMRLGFSSSGEWREEQDALYSTPMNEAGLAAFRTATKSGVLISPAMAQAIADDVLRSAGLVPKERTTTYGTFVFGGGNKDPKPERN